MGKDSGGKRGKKANACLMKRSVEGSKQLQRQAQAERDKRHDVARAAQQRYLAAATAQRQPVKFKQLKPGKNMSKQNMRQAQAARDAQTLRNRRVLIEAKAAAKEAAKAAAAADAAARSKQDLSSANVAAAVAIAVHARDPLPELGEQEWAEMQRWFAGYLTEQLGDNEKDGAATVLSRYLVAEMQARPDSWAAAVESGLRMLAPDALLLSPALDRLMSAVEEAVAKVAPDLEKRKGDGAHIVEANGDDAAGDKDDEDEDDDLQTTAEDVAAELAVAGPLLKRMQHQSLHKRRWCHEGQATTADEAPEDGARSRTVGLAVRVDKKKQRKRRRKRGITVNET